MGVRLLIELKRTNKALFYGTKLYGYGVDIHPLEYKGIKYLYDNGYIDKAEIDWFVDVIQFMTINIDGKHLKEFLIEYDKDLKKFEVYGTTEKDFLKAKEIKKILKDSDDKKYCISWG